MAVETMQVPRQNLRPIGAEDIVARRVAYERRRRDWSNAELAKRMTDAGCPLNQSAIQKIEKGMPRRTISLDEALAFAEVFGLTLDELRSFPEERLGADLADFKRALEEVDTETVSLLEKALGLVNRMADNIFDAQGLIEYMGGDVSIGLDPRLPELLHRQAEAFVKLAEAIRQLDISAAEDAR
jgi:transcriptional regulator with XRE-family HTH domain